MFCSSCGSAVPPGLSYCNRCGADLHAKELSPVEPARRSGPYPDSLVWGIVAVTTVGLCAVIALMVIMKEVVHFNEGLINAFSVATFLSFLLVDALFAWLLLSSKRAQEKSFDAAELNAELTRELTAQQIQSLPGPRQSVTEQTTRTLEAVPRSKQD
jgi:predicted amidophosphoribosyltransferase